MKLAAAFACLLLAACAGRSAGERAADWLWSRQQPDGSWRSAHYAVLRSGQAMTPFVLRALMASGTAGHDEAVARALASVRASIDAEGAIGYADAELLEYPVYATSLAILVLAQARAPADSERIAKMAAWLARQQCNEARGFTRESPAYGAFAFGARGLAPGEPGHVDLTHTRLALQALAAAGRLDAEVRERALVLLGRLQHEDGGCHYSPVVDSANKAGRDGEGRFRSYATATADGLLAMRALGFGEGDARVAAARNWLERHFAPDRIGGIGADPPEPWHEALRFYHAMVVAEAHPPARAALREMLAGLQGQDGSFRSVLVTAMKEDDPLLATALALCAFGSGE